MLGYILFGVLIISAIALILNNVISIGYFLYMWSEGSAISTAAWDAFLLYIVVGFISLILFLMSHTSIKMMDRATTKYSNKRLP